MPSGHLPSRAERLIAAAGHDGNPRLEGSITPLRSGAVIAEQRRVVERMVLTLYSANFI
jgi:hypothetical protein